MSYNGEVEKEQLIQAAMALPGVAQMAEVYQNAAERMGLSVNRAPEYSFSTSANVVAGRR